MKKIFFILALSLGMMACESDVKFNNPAFEAERNYSTSWKANEFSASVNQGALMITATDGVEVLVLRTAAYEFGGKYDLGIVASNRAKLVHDLEDGKQLIFETGAKKGSGYVEFAPLEDQVPGTITGKFVVALRNDKDSVVSFQKGIFYRVPMEEAK
ncbi:DUF6252 family protein [Flavobacterium sp. JP2137]|uniref:DUF6252 family protein n=1 Tax=Flavobacterium sp. JP2137 TaxID=3414510 RepID=UPI003D2FFDC2